MNVPIMNDHAGSGAVIFLHLTPQCGKVWTVVIGGIAGEVVRSRNAAHYAVALSRTAPAR
jgi:hypothetical protein